MRKRYTDDQIRRLQISNMSLKTRVMLAKTKKRPIKGHVFNYARTVKAKHRAATKRQPHIIRLPADLQCLTFPPKHWG